MRCNLFRANHVAYVDDLLSAADMSAMREHAARCDDCGALDVRVRRSLMLVRSMPEIRPSPEFSARLESRLREARLAGPIGGTGLIEPRWYRQLSTGRLAAAAAVLVTAALLSMSAFEPTPVAADVPAMATTALAPESLEASDASALIAAVPAGIPVWPAVFMVGQLPMHLASVELVEGEFTR